MAGIARSTPLPRTGGAGYFPQTGPEGGPATFSAGRRPLSPQRTRKGGSMKRSVHWIALVSLVTLANCGGGDGAGNASCRGKIKTYAECGVWEGGAANCHQFPETQYDTCIASCVQDMSCALI